MIKNDDGLQEQMSRVRKLAAAFVSLAHGTKTAPPALSQPEPFARLSELL